MSYLCSAFLYYYVTIRITDCTNYYQITKPMYYCNLCQKEEMDQPAAARREGTSFPSPVEETTAYTCHVGDHG